MDDYAKIEHDMAAMLRESFPVTWPPGLATKLSLQFLCLITSLGYRKCFKFSVSFFKLQRYWIEF